MTQSASAVTQLYGLLGLHLTDRDAVDTALPKFSSRHDRVPTMSGCIRFDEKVERIAEEIARGNYDVAVTRPWREIIISPAIIR